MPPLTGYNYFLENALKYGWMIPSGGIIMWSGLIADIPTGWAFCNGLNNTPNLRDRFIVGASADSGGVAKTYVTGSYTQSGGNIGHTHGFTSNSHTHSFTGNGHTHFARNTVEVQSGSGTFAWAGNETETFSTAAAGTTGAESVTGTTDNEDVLPPYFALAFIMKT